MKTKDLFSFNRSSTRLNESLAKTFGKKINFESFDLEQLQDARNKLRTQLSQIRNGSGFNENLENDTFHQAQFMLDAINSEIANRDQHIVDSDVDEGFDEIDIDLQTLANRGDEEDLIAALDGDMGPGTADVLNDMMDELKDELASKGMNDVMNDEDKMIEMLWDKIVDEYGGRDSDEGGETDDAYALASAGHGSDEDYREDYDKDEYDEEGEMALTQLKTIEDAADELADILDTDENLPEWVQKKISMAMDYLDTARDYMKSTDEVEKEKMMKDRMPFGEGRLSEGEIQQASAIVTAKTMVDRVGRWIEELSGMENDTLLQLGDSIRDEMGQEAAKNFISTVAPAIQQALENLKSARETLSTGVRTLTGEEQPAEMLGAEPESAGEEVGAAEPDQMNAEPATDEFAAAEPATGGAEEAGREQRESIDYQNKLLKVLAG